MSERKFDSRQQDLQRIREALETSAEVLRAFTPGAVAVELKRGGDPVTAADREINDRLFRLLPKEGEGWLSEETVDDLRRLESRRVWVVDPLDGTREFVEGIPEWCVSIGLVEDGRPVAGGVNNVAKGEMFIGSIETGVSLNGRPTKARGCEDLKNALVLASRSEVKRGEWDRFRVASFTVRPVGSVAYKLACVAAGLADATWTLVPKHEWDVAGGVALVMAAGGVVRTLGGHPPTFNRPDPVFEGLVAFNANSQGLFRALTNEWLDGWQSSET